MHREILQRLEPARGVEGLPAKIRKALGDELAEGDSGRAGASRRSEHELAVRGQDSVAHAGAQLPHLNGAAGRLKRGVEPGQDRGGPSGGGEDGRYGQRDVGDADLARLHLPHGEPPEVEPDVDGARGEDRFVERERRHSDVLEVQLSCGIEQRALERRAEPGFRELRLEVPEHELGHGEFVG